MSNVYLKVSLIRLSNIKILFFFLVSIIAQLMNWCTRWQRTVSYLTPTTLFKKFELCWMGHLPYKGSIKFERGSQFEIWIANYVKKCRPPFADRNSNRELRSRIQFYATAYSIWFLMSVFIYIRLVAKPTESSKTDFKDVEVHFCWSTHLRLWSTLRLIIWV